MGKHLAPACVQVADRGNMGGVEALSSARPSRQQPVTDHGTCVDNRTSVSDTFSKKGRHLAPGRRFERPARGEELVVARCRGRPGQLTMKG